MIITPSARARFFTYTDKESSEENWMFLDEYEDREGFDKWMKASNKDPELLKLVDEFFPKWNSLIVPGYRKTEVWSEDEGLRVEFK